MWWMVLAVWRTCGKRLRDGEAPIPAIAVAKEGEGLEPGVAAIAFYVMHFDIPVVRLAASMT